MLYSQSSSVVCFHTHKVLPPTLHVMGRIAHVQVWDYIDKLQSSSSRVSINYRIAGIFHGGKFSRNGITELIHTFIVQVTQAHACTARMHNTANFHGFSPLQKLAPSEKYPLYGYIELAQ